MQIILSLLLCALGATADLESAGFQKMEALPDPFLFADGSAVETREDWQRRREEIKALLLKYEYGSMPPAPGPVQAKAVAEARLVNNGATRLEEFVLSFGPQDALQIPVRVYVPVKGTAPFPAVVRFGLGDECVPSMTARGYIFACFDQHALDLDTEGYDEIGPAQAAYPDEDWGCLAVWAWGASRVADYLHSRADVYGDKLVITGHSRTGKAALLAGGMDERFALVVPNGSGCGGAAAFRNTPKRAESLELITRESRFAAWFKKDFARFGDNEAYLPFDQHFLRALVAPRALLDTEALEDHWCNPPGTQTAWLAAQPVFDFLGVPQRNKMHFRPGRHDQLPEDFAVLLDFADELFHGKTSPRPLNTPYAPYFGDWKIPGGSGK
jgi:hypothetical protein